MNTSGKGINDTEASAEGGERWKLIRQHSAFNGLDDTQLKKVIGYFPIITGRKGQILIQEGMESSDLFLVLEGRLEVVKRDSFGDGSFSSSERSTRFRLAAISGGDIIGELSFVTGNARSATITCITPSELLSISRVQFDLLEHMHPQIYSRMLKNILTNIAERVKQSSVNEVRSLRTELHRSLLNSRSNLFFSYVIGLLCTYNMAIHIIISLSSDSGGTSLISAIIIFLFAGVLILMLRHSRLPLRVIGLTRRNWKPALRESMIWTLIIIVICVAVKWILIRTVPQYKHLPLFDFDPASHRYLAFNFILYGLHSPIQEFISRGVLQGSLQHFFTGKNVTLRAVIVSNALFSATHVHLMNGVLALLVFVPGLFWGWLYSRHENLIGVSVSHVLIGWSLLFFLDIGSLFLN